MDRGAPKVCRYVGPGGHEATVVGKRSVPGNRPGIRFLDAKSTTRLRRFHRVASASEINPFRRSAATASSAESRSLAPRASTAASSTPRTRAAPIRLLQVIPGGRIAWIPCNRLELNSTDSKVRPVTFVPGLARLATTQILTGSPTAPITMGILCVALLAARAACPRSATITSGSCRTSSAAREASVSGLP
jgi:hypothetical protein